MSPQKTKVGESFTREVPNGTFVHENSGEPLRYVATLVDGSPLPNWVAFNGETQTFNGRVPDVGGKVLDVVVKAVDRASQEAQVQMRIKVQ